MTSKATCVAWANRALVRAAAAFAAFAAYRSLHSSSTTIKLASEGHSRFDFGRGRRTLQLERAIAVAALVLKTSEAQSAFAGRAAA